MFVFHAEVVDSEVVERRFKSSLVGYLGYYREQQQQFRAKVAMANYNRDL